MRARLLVPQNYSANWCLTPKPLEAGMIVPVVPATNLPYKNCYWVNTPELENDPYGVLLHPGEYELIEEEADNA